MLQRSPFDVLSSRTAHMFELLLIGVVVAAAAAACVM